MFASYTHLFYNSGRGVGERRNAGMGKSEKKNKVKGTEKKKKKPETS